MVSGFYVQVIVSIFELKISVIRFVFGFLPVPLPASLGIRFSPTGAADSLHFIAYWLLRHLAVFVMFWRQLRLLVKA